MQPHEEQAIIHRNRGKRLAAECRMVEAIEELKLAVEQDPRDGKSWQLLAQLYGAAGYHEQAVSYAQKAVREDFTSMPAWVILINLYAQIGGPYFELALEQVELAKAINDGIPDIWYLEGNVLAQKGETAAAKECFQKCLEIHPKHPYAANDLAAIS